MACLEIASTTSNNNNNGSIAELLRRIDKMQKDAIAANAIGTCNTCVIAPVFNTKPIAIYLCNEALTVPIGNTTEFSNRFRVEEVKGDIVVLRLLSVVNEELTCTTYTVTVRINCICCVQCFDPITCVINCALAA